VHTRLGSKATLVACAAGLLMATPARAGERAVLQLERGAEAASCPDEKALSDLVAARLGYEPFDDAAALRVSVRFVEGAGQALQSEVKLFDRDGTEKGERVLVSSRGDCEELASTTALTISILLDPRSGMGPRPVGPPPAPVWKEPAEEPPKPKVLARTTTPVEKSRLALRARVDADLALGLTPSLVAPGLQLGVGLGGPWWSLEVELRGGWPLRASRSGYELAVGFYGAGVVPCAQIAPFYGCIGGWLGALRTSVTGGVPAARSSLHALVGPRFGLSLPMTRRLALDAHVDGLYSPTTTEVYDRATRAWSTSPLSAVLAIGALGHFP
jgi:hypothetical protein